VKENLNAEQWVHKNLEPLMAHDSKARLWFRHAEKSTSASNSLTEETPSPISFLLYRPQSILIPLTQP
jgi:hypothetical protein